MARVLVMTRCINLWKVLGKRGSNIEIVSWEDLGG